MTVYDVYVDLGMGIRRTGRQDKGDFNEPKNTGHFPVKTIVPCPALTTICVFSIWVADIAIDLLSNC